MSRRLAEMSEESLESGGRSARKAVEEAGFSEELKARLEQKIADASFRSENASAFARVNLPSSAGKGSELIATSKPWSGNESVEDGVLRMLDDAHKPLRTGRPPRLPSIRGPPKKIDTGRPSKSVSGARLANARDKTSIYAFLKDDNLTEEEREKYRKELKDRFQPGARNAPATVQGLTSLANERIEDAIARGQFKNLPRGKDIVRDYNASNPFLDTTEYFMNKMIQKQEIVPPWIEKQQELVSTATRFRGRLRSDWRRHVARMIASKGGSLQDQMRAADEYALAESLENPSTPKVEQVNSVDNQGHVSQITLAGEVTDSADAQGAQPTNIKVIEQTVQEGGSLSAPSTEVEIITDGPSEELQQSQHANQRRPNLPPFRDPQWEATERSYQELAIQNLNSLTRSYNLMAPDLAKKPYFSLGRELRSCYADVAPQVAGAIRDRALAPKLKGVEVVGHKPGGVLEKFAMNRASHVHDERKPQYGFKEFWRDLFSSS